MRGNSDLLADLFDEITFGIAHIFRNVTIRVGDLVADSALLINTNRCFGLIHVLCVLG